MNYKYPNYNDCIANLACSILKHFDCNYTHNTISDVDKALEENNPKNVIVILYDGMGYNLVNRILPEDSFMRQNMLKSYSSVCPSTTTASTTSMLSGMYPNEHGWLGWNLYIPPFGKIVTMFRNTLKDKEEQAADYNVATKYYPYVDLIENINKNSNSDAYIISTFAGIRYDDLNDMINKILETSQKDGKKYIYAYFEDPDGLMHQFGTDSKEAKKSFFDIDEATRKLADKLEDSILIITADHGHKNCDNITISDYKDFKDTLDGNVWVEGRFCAFKVKDEINFLKLFKKYFAKDFLLKTKEEIINEKIFGNGIDNKYFRDSLGDYFAIGVSNKTFRYDENGNVFASTHAGLTEDEMDIPLVLKVKK